MPSPTKPKPKRRKKQHDLRAATLVRLADGMEEEARVLGTAGPTVSGLVQSSSPLDIANAATANSLAIQARVFRAEAKRTRRLR